MKYTPTFILSFFFFFTAMTQADESKEEVVIQTFRDTRVINSHSVETLAAGRLDFRVAHRFGDIAGSSGGWQTFYGLESAADIMIGLEYGLSDKVMIGINRTKGSGPLKQNINGVVKFRLMNQERNGNLPISLAVVGLTSFSTMQKSEIEGVLNFFEKGSHRLTYHLGVLFARKFSDAFSAQFHTSWTFRNVVPPNDQNDLASIGGAIRLQVSKAMGIILDVTSPVLSNLRNSENDYYPAFGIGFEFDTSGGHVFQVNLTNATGINETDYIPYTRTSWADGEFRLGFTISRQFRL